jgi:hypothetical protein
MASQSASTGEYDSASLSLEEEEAGEQPSGFSISVVSFDRYYWVIPIE